MADPAHVQQLQDQLIAMQQQMQQMQQHMQATAQAAPPLAGTTVTVPGLTELVTEMQRTATRDVRVLVDQRGLGRPTVSTATKRSS